MLYYTRKKIKISIEGLIEKIFSFVYCKRILSLENNLKKKSPNDLEIKKYYDKYVSEISTSGMAISLESSLTILSLLEYFKPKSILDLGSGFSSFLFRLYKKNAQYRVNIISVDHDIQWIQKSRIFLSYFKLDDENFILSDNFFQSKDKNKNFDFILNDFSSGSYRDKITRLIPNFTNSNSCMVFDDMQNYKHKKAVMRVIMQNNYRYVDLKNYTFDFKNRYQWLVIK